MAVLYLDCSMSHIRPYYAVQMVVFLPDACLGGRRRVGQIFLSLGNHFLIGLSCFVLPSLVFCSICGYSPAPPSLSAMSSRWEGANLRVHRLSLRGPL